MLRPWRDPSATQLGWSSRSLGTHASPICRLLLEVRQPCQVLAQHIDRYRRKHKHQAHPHSPVMMHASPVSRRNFVPGSLFVCLQRILNVGILALFRPFVSVLTVVRFAHCCTSVHFQFRIAGRSRPGDPKFGTRRTMSSTMWKRSRSLVRRQITIAHSSTACCRNSSLRPALGRVERSQAVDPGRSEKD
jgi:hypothetical protein